MKIPRAYGIPTNLLKATEAMYTNKRAVLVTPDGMTQEFDIFAGVLQRYTLAPYIFIICWNKCTAKSNRRRRMPDLRASTSLGRVWRIEALG